MVHKDLSEVDQQRYEEVFKRLDCNKNGKIDVHDLSKELGNLEKHYAEHYAQVSSSQVNRRVTLFHSRYFLFAALYQKVG